MREFERVRVFIRRFLRGGFPFETVEDLRRLFPEARLSSPMMARGSRRRTVGTRCLVAAVIAKVADVAGVSIIELPDPPGRIDRC
jgi:hypothetical protein